MIRVMIIGGGELLRGALAAMLAREPDLSVVAALAPTKDTDAVTPRPQVAIVDLDGWEEDGLEVARRLAATPPGCRTLVLTSQRRQGPLRAILDAGVAGLLGRDDPPDTLARWVRRVAAGERVIDPALAAALLEPTSNPLTPREQSVLRLASDGLPSAEIARRLHLAPGTIRNYLSSAMRKTGARNRLEAARRAREAGWL